MICLYFPSQYQKQQTIHRTLSRNSYLKGTSGAAWILCAVMTDQPLASPTGYSQGKIIFKLKSQPIRHSLCRTRVCVSSEKRRGSLCLCLPSLSSSVVFGGWAAHGKLGCNLIILYIRASHCNQSIGFPRAAIIFPISVLSPLMSIESLINSQNLVLYGMKLSQAVKQPVIIFGCQEPCTVLGA